MSVHLQIKTQINRFIDAEKKYRELDMQREQKIAAVIGEAAQGKKFSLMDVNNITEKINQLSKSFGFPLRKTVTDKMVKEFVNK
ncbi:DUF2533 family protein [Bacillaceae bacterium IKA-2]|nr:DUF2533 family protein [Bacillaceae bacterium IKA-2]